VVGLKDSNWLTQIALNLLLFGIELLPGLIAYLGIAGVRAGFSPDYIYALDFESYVSVLNMPAVQVVTHAAAFMTAYLHYSMLTLAYLEFIRRSDGIEAQVAAA